MADIFINYAYPHKLMIDEISYQLMIDEMIDEISKALNEIGFSTFISKPSMEEVEWGWFSYVKTEIAKANLIILIWSKGSENSKRMHWEMQVALEGWETSRLLLVRLDDAELPVGLRDINHLDISNATLSESIQSIVEAVQTSKVFESAPRPTPDELSDLYELTMPSQFPLEAERLEAERLEAERLEAERLEAERLEAERLETKRLDAPFSRRSSRLIFAISAFLAGIGTGLLFGTDWLFGADSWDDSDFLVDFPVKAIAVGVLAVLGMLGVLVVGGIAASLLLDEARLILRHRLQKKPSQPKKQDLPLSQEQNLIQKSIKASSQGALFISYSRQDTSKVIILLEELDQCGLETWIDVKYEAEAQRFAGRIVDAIRSSKACAFMCSSHAYQSDQVVRELYLADKYKKPMIPVEIEPGTPTEEFEYFFSGLFLVPAIPTKECVRVIMRRLNDS
jgi:hypothetical protein